MSLRTWGWGRLLLLTLAYWVVVVTVVAARLRASVRAEAAAYQAAHPGQQDYLVATAVSANPLHLLAVLAGPPLALVALWLWMRRT